MLAGMYVIHDGATCQVLAIQAAPIGYTGRTPSRYTLRRVNGGTTYGVTDPALELTPACDHCRRPRGLNACAATGVHEGPPKMAPAHTPEPDRSGGGDAWCGDCRRKVRVVSESTESTTTSVGLAMDRVSDLACGHTAVRNLGVRLWSGSNPEPWSVSV